MLSRAHLGGELHVGQEEVHHVEGLSGALPDAHKAHPAGGHLALRTRRRGRQARSYLQQPSAKVSFLESCG